jgi:type 1 glutamine amidotransferase
VDPTFPGLKGQTDFTLHEEWYSLKNFQPDLHVILVQDTEGMRGPSYQRPNFPATWARMHGKGRVFYTSLGHPADFDDPAFRKLLLNGICWTLDIAAPGAAAGKGQARGTGGQ